MLSYGRQGSYHLLRFAEVADFQISSNAKEITCYPAQETTHDTIRHLLLDQVLPRCISYQGNIVLHSSAVEFEGGLILLLGDSGTGKSTLAGNFHQVGLAAVSDDCLCLQEVRGQISAIPSYMGLRLWEDSLEVLFEGERDTRSVAHYSAKRRVQLGEQGNPRLSCGIPVRAVILLASSKQSLVSDLSLERLSRREAFIALMKQSFHLTVTDFERLEQHVLALGRVAPRLPSFRLSMPHDYALLPLVRQKILEAVL